MAEEYDFTDKSEQEILLSTAQIQNIPAIAASLIAITCMTGCAHLFPPCEYMVSIPDRTSELHKNDILLQHKIQ